MTVNATTTISAAQAADGSNRNWYFPFKIVEKNQIVLYLLDANALETRVTSGYTVVGVGSDNGGEVTYPLAPIKPLPLGVTVKVGRLVAYEQPDRLGNQGPYFPRIHEGALDRLEMQIQQLAENVSRSPLYPIFTPPPSTVTFPPPDPGHVLIWDESGNLTNSATDVAAFETSAINAQAAAEIAMAMAATAADAAAAASGAAGAADLTVVDRAALAAVPPGPLSLWLGELGREGWFRWNAADLSAAVALDPYQGIHVAPVSAPDGASGAWVRVRDKTFVNIEWFGAKEWSFGDFTANIQSALDFAGNEGGECYVPTRIYKQSATLHMKKTCWLHGAGNWQTTYKPLATTTGAYGSRLMWTTAVVPGAASMPQVLVESSPQGTQLLQPRVTDLALDGNAFAGMGVQVSASLQPVVRDIWAEQHIICGVGFLPRGGSTVGLTWDNIVTQTRTQAACFGACGLIMDATDATSFNTGGHGGFLRALASTNCTGWGLKIGNQDAFGLDKFEIFGFGSAGGGALWFTFDPAKGGGASRKHYIHYFAGGLIRTDPGCYGIKIQSGSEASSIDIAPGSHVNLEMFDQSTGDFYESLQYRFTDERDLMPSTAVLSGATLSTLGGSSAISLADGATNSATWTHTAPPEWNHGRIMGLRVVYGMSTADPATNCRLKVTVSCPRTDGTTPASGSSVEFTRTETFTVAGAAVADTFYTADLQIAWPPEFKKRCAVVVTLQRMADGSEPIVTDSSTQALKIVSVKELYKADGPNATGGEGLGSGIHAGRWETGVWSMDQSYSDYIGGTFPFIAASAFEPETLTLLDALVDPEPWQFQQTLINRTIKDLKDAGLWTAFDLLYFTGQQHEQWSKVHWLTPGTRDLTEAGAVAPVFVKLQGYHGSASGYLSTGINWAALTQYQRDNCHAGAFIYNQGTAGFGVFGTPTTVGVILIPQHTTNVFQTRLNNTTIDSFANTSSRGHFMANRVAGPSYTQWARGVLVNSPVRASEAVINEEVVICRASGTNGVNNVSAFHCGRALTSLEIVNLNRILAYHVGHMTG